MSFRNVFNIKDKVFVKRRGYPPWPAIIYSVNTNTQQTTYNVFLYGSGDCIECKTEHLLLYEENKSKLKLNRKNSKYKLLVKAFYEIQDTPVGALLLSENDTQKFSTPSCTKQLVHPAETLDESKDVDRIQLINQNLNQYHSENQKKSKTNVSNEFTYNEDFISRNNVNFTASKKTKRKISDNQIKKCKKKINKSLAIESYKLDETQHNLNEENMYDLSKPQSKPIEPAKASTLGLFSQGLCNIEQGSDTDQFVDIHKINKANNCSPVNDRMLEVNKSSLLKKNNLISTLKKRKKKESTVKPKKKSKKSISNISQDVEILKKNKSSIESNEISARLIKNGSIYVQKFQLKDIQPIVLVEKLNDQLLALLTNKNKNIMVDQKVLKTYDKHVETVNTTKSTIESSETMCTRSKGSKSTYKLTDSNILYDQKVSISHVNDVSFSSPSLKTTNLVNPKKPKLSRLSKRLSKATKEHNVCKIETDDILEQNCKTKGSSSNSNIKNTLNCSDIPMIHINDSVSKETNQFRIKRSAKNNAKFNNETESTVEYSDPLLDSSKRLKFTSKLTDSNTLSDQKPSISHVNNVSFSSPSLKTTNFVNSKNPRLSRLNKRLSKATKEHNVYKIETDDILEQNCKTKGTNSNSTENTLKYTDIPSIHINDSVSKENHKFITKRSDKHVKSNNETESTAKSSVTLLDTIKSLKFTSKLTDSNTLSDQKASTSHVNDVSCSSPSLKTNLVNRKKPRLSRLNKRLSKDIKKHDTSKIETNHFFESNCSSSNSKTENTQECTHTPSIHINNGLSKETQQFNIKRSEEHAKSNNKLEPTIESSDTLLNSSKSLKLIIKLNNCNTLSNEKTSKSYARHESCLSPNLETTNIVNPKKSRLSRLNKRLSKAIKINDASKIETDGILEQNCYTKGTNSNSKTENTLKCTDIPSIHINDSVSKENHKFITKRSDKHAKSNNEIESTAESSVTLLDTIKSLKFTSKLTDSNTLSDQKASTSHVNDVSCSSPSLKTNFVNRKKPRLSRLNKRLSKTTKEHNVCKIETDNFFAPNCTNSNSETKDTLKSIPSPSLYSKLSVSKEKLKLSKKINNLPLACKEIVTDFVASLEINSKEQQSEAQKIAQINLLQVEVDTLDYIYKLRSALSINHFDYELALQSLDKISKLEINAPMLIKHRTIYDTIKKVTLYVGNASEWKLNKQEAIEHAEKASKVRYKAQILYHKFVLLFTNGDLEKFKEIYDKNL